VNHYRMVAESDDYCDAALEADSSETASDGEVASVRDAILGPPTVASLVAVMRELRDELAGAS